MANLTVDVEPIPYDESHITINGFEISHNNKTVCCDTIQLKKFAQDNRGRYWDVELIPDGTGVVVSVEVNTDQVSESDSIEYETDRFSGRSEFCTWLESGEFELISDD